MLWELFSSIWLQPFLLTEPSTSCSHELTHYVIAQLVVRPQDMSDLRLIDLSWLHLHPSYQTGYHICAVASLPFSFLFLALHTGLSLTQQVWDSCLRQHLCVWGYLSLWFAPLRGRRSSSVSSYEKEREMDADVKGCSKKLRMISGLWEAHFFLAWAKFRCNIYAPGQAAAGICLCAPEHHSAILFSRPRLM